VSSPLVEFDLCRVKVAHNGFKAMVRQNSFDVGELAIVTFLQAKAYGEPTFARLRRFRADSSATASVTATRAVP
jgi:hypothetical protein